MKRIYQFLFTLVIIFLLVTDLTAQGLIYDGPEDGAGDPYLEREGFMTGNRVQLLFKNNTELGDYPRKDAARWPKGVGGNVMHDGLGILISAPVFITTGNVPVTDPAQIEALAMQNLIDTLYYCQTNYREEMDRDPTGQIEWGLHPAPGYINNLSETPAMSNDPFSWPPDGWLYTDRLKHWPGEWDGRFGRGQIRADLEAYFVANDAQDLEYLGDDDRIKYFPRPGLKIGDIDPSVTVQKGQPWGGLGIRVKQRVFQWNNSLAQDCIFSEYTIANISDYDLPYVAFGYWLDNDIGGENAGEDGSFDRLEDLSYSWDTDGVGEDGYPTGTAGYAYLESPGIYEDNIDNDEDGLIDERRDNDAGIYQPFVPTDLQKYLVFYGLKEEDLPENHWSGDEDADWMDGEDVNGDKIYQSDEFAGDDIGLDGVAPGEENYQGPDADGTECNHRPDHGEGYAEPNFSWTDVSETDMLGLTTLIFQEAVPHTDPYVGWFRHDQSVWEDMTSDTLMSGASQIQNLFELFSTAIFPLYKGSTQFISISELHSYDDLAGLSQSPTHLAPALFTLKKTVQVIYEKDYRFAQPPKMPTLKALPGDGYVQLIWDNRADRLTREPFLANANDFEGYKIFRSTDKDMRDPMVITDGYGTRTLLKPLFQCDLRDGRRGFTDYGLINGMGYNLGDDSGIAYSFKDETVQNGRTYYYAVIAYDYGIRAEELKGTSIVAQDSKYGIPPSENNVVIRQDEYENIDFIGANVAIVTPGNEGAGNVIETEFNVDDSNCQGSGTITPEVVDYKLIDPDRTYTIKFTITRLDSATRFGLPYSFYYTASGLRVYDQERLVFEDVVMKTDQEILVPKNYTTVLETYDNNTSDSADDFYHLAFNAPRATEIFEGLRLLVKMDVRTAQYDFQNSGWMPGSAPINIVFNEYQNEIQNFSWDYNIIFSDHVLYTGKLPTAVIRDENYVRIDEEELLFNQEFNFKVETADVKDSLGHPYQLEMVVHDLNGNQSFDMLEDRVLVGMINTRDRWDVMVMAIDFLQAQNANELPQPNDVYRLHFKKPYFTTDSITFRVNAKKRFNAEQAKYTMDNIQVVPNPYVASNMMEPSVVNKYLNQRRRLLFTHLPEKCTIKIFTISGLLVRELHAPEDALTNFGGYGNSSNGVLHWDMLTKEGLEIAAGMYFYYVKDDITGNEKTGKFAVLK